LERLIGTALGRDYKDFDSFLPTGVEIKRGKRLTFKIPNGKRFIRCDSIGDDYSEAAILERKQANCHVQRNSGNAYR